MERSLKRLEMWGGLWLQRLFVLLDFVCGEPRHCLRDWFDAKIKGVSKTIMVVFVGHAVLRRTRSKQSRFHDPRRSYDLVSLRGLIGADLRRAFRARTIPGRLRNIRRALEQRDVLIARIARRLRKGLTRIAAAFTRAPLCVDDAGAMGVAFAGLDATLFCAPNTS